MSGIGEKLEEELEALKQLRDELRVQAELGKAEARDAWEGLEKRWQQLESRARQLREASRDDLADIGEATRLLIGEIKEGYQHLRKRI